MKVSRPALRYYGGKWRLSSWIIQHFPAHKVYTEVFGGGGSVLLRKPRSYAEIYNDLDEEVVNLFTVYRDDGDELKRRVKLTPFAREEFVAAYTPSDDPIERARRCLIRSFMGFGSAAVAGQNTGFRCNSNRSGTTPAHDWFHYHEHMDAIIQRLRGVVIENKPAIEVLRQQDAPDALHYVDPPYVHDTRNSKHLASYNYEMSDQDHEALAEVLMQLDGCVVLSGYKCPLYDELYHAWHRVEKEALADGANKRLECLWISKPMEPAFEGFFRG